MIPFPGKAFFQAKIPSCPDKRSTKHSPSGKSETTPQHTREPKLQLETIRKATVYPKQHQRGWISYHKACSHVAWYCVSSWKHPSSKCSHTHTEQPRHTAACRSLIFMSVKSTVRFEDMAELNKCLAQTIMEVSPLKSCAKNRVANHNSRYSTPTKC